MRVQLSPCCALKAFQNRFICLVVPMLTRRPIDQGFARHRTHQDFFLPQRSLTAGGPLAWPNQ